MYMDEWELDGHIACRYDGVRGRAATLLGSFRDEVNQGSDGWCHWVAARRAAAKLTELVAGRTPATEGALRAARTPIRAFCTRHKRPPPEG